MVQGTAVVEKSVNKYSYKLLLQTLKVLPMVLALCDCTNTYLAFYGIEFPLLSYIGGISFTSWLFIYIAAVVFKFCIYHRMFLYYVLLNNILSIYEFQYGIPVDDAGLIRIYSFITALFLFLILFFYHRERHVKHSTESTPTNHRQH